MFIYTMYISVYLHYVYLRLFRSKDQGSVMHPNLDPIKIIRRKEYVARGLEVNIGLNLFFLYFIIYSLWEETNKPIYYSCQPFCTKY